MVVLESPTTRLRFTRDRAQLLLSFQPIDGKPGEWFSLGLLRGLLQGDRGGSEVLDEGWAEFLRASLAELEARLANRKSADVLISGLRAQAKLRAKQLIG